MPRATPENLLEGLLVSAPVRADHHGGGGTEGQAAEIFVRRVDRERHHVEVGRPAERGKRLQHRPVAHQHEERLRHEWLHVDLEGAATMTRHRIGHEALDAPRLGSPLAHEGDQARLAVLERLQRLTDDHGLGAGAADPAGDGAVPADQRLGPGLGGGRALAPHDGGEREGLTAAPQLHRQVQHVHAHRPPTSLSQKTG